MGQINRKVNTTANARGGLIFKERAGVAEIDIGTSLSALKMNPPLAFAVVCYFSCLFVPRVDFPKHHLRSMCACIL